MIWFHGEDFYGKLKSFEYKEFDMITSVFQFVATPSFASSSNHHLVTFLYWKLNLNVMQTGSSELKFNQKLDWSISLYPPCSHEGVAGPSCTLQWT